MTPKRKAILPRLSNTSQVHITKSPPSPLDSADALLIAKARSLGATIVTHELPNPESKKRVLIPDVCTIFDVPFMNTFEALKRFSAKFIWSP
nr:DUF4411 family protein [Rhizobium leguminosarum]